MSLIALTSGGDLDGCFTQARIPQYEPRKKRINENGCYRLKAKLARELQHCQNKI